MMLKQDRHRYFYITLFLVLVTDLYYYYSTKVIICYYNTYFYILLNVNKNLILFLLKLLKINIKGLNLIIKD